MPARPFYQKRVQYFKPGYNSLSVLSRGGLGIHQAAPFKKTITPAISLILAQSLSCLKTETHE